MKRVQQAPLWKMCLGGFIYLLIAGPSLLWLGLSLGPGLVIVAALLSPVFAALVIRKIVRSINERDDSRQAKMPEGPP